MCGPGNRSGQEVRLGRGAQVLFLNGDGCVVEGEGFAGLHSLDRERHLCGVPLPWLREVGEESLQNGCLVITRQAF